MPIHPVDRAIDGLARRQHGVFHRRQAVRLGATRSLIRNRLATGRWIRLLESSVLGLPSHAGTWLRQCSAATLSVPGSAISGPSAAALHGFPGWPRSRLEVCTRHGATHVSPFADVRETRTVGRLVVVEGIRVVSAADCLVQVAPMLGAGRLGELVDEVGAHRPRLLAELRDRHVALAPSRLPGIGHLREVLEARSDDRVPPRSALERHLRAVVEGDGPPGFEVEATPPWLGEQRGRVDVLIPDWRLVVEGDGRAWHTRVADFEHDRWRDAEALAHGYATIRFTWFQLVQRPAWCRNVLVAVGADRSGASGRRTAA